MPRIHSDCAGCGAPFSYEAEEIGTVGCCSACGHRFVIGAKGKAAEPLPQPVKWGGNPASSSQPTSAPTASHGGLAKVVGSGILAGIVAILVWTLFPLPTIPGLRAGHSITKEQYQRIEMGMSYAEVCKIIGWPGDEMSRNQINGVNGVMPTIDTVMYGWSNANGSNILLMFQNDRLIQRAQFGL